MIFLEILSLKELFIELRTLAAGDEKLAKELNKIEILAAKFLTPIKTLDKGVFELLNNNYPKEIDNKLNKTCLILDPSAKTEMLSFLFSNKIQGLFSKFFTISMHSFTISFKLIKFGVTAKLFVLM